MNPIVPRITVNPWAAGAIPPDKACLSGEAVEEVAAVVVVAVEAATGAVVDVEEAVVVVEQTLPGGQHPGGPPSKIMLEKTKG